MTKPILLLCVLALGGCSAQSKTVFIADFENVCAYPVSLTVHEYSNAKEPFVANTQVAQGEVAEVLSYISFNNELEDSFPESYRLDIAAHGNTHSLDKTHFLTQLERSAHERRGNAIYAWKISDATLCP
ncbi:hypothetical protein [Pseudomonas leptonychotis]|uniref:hypothetical protein n=1 Tax=Pseudomonas leptonychotis TaxID=2448482 RepID=UPI0039F0D77B